jgi:hypothetical protein
MVTEKGGWFPLIHQVPPICSPSGPPELAVVGIKMNPGSLFNGDELKSKAWNPPKTP